MATKGQHFKLIQNIKGTGTAPPKILTKKGPPQVLQKVAGTIKKCVQSEGDVVGGIGDHVPFTVIKV